jgi:hypothetical protein
MDNEIIKWGVAFHPQLANLVIDFESILPDHNYLCAQIPGFVHLLKIDLFVIFLDSPIVPFKGACEHLKTKAHMIRLPTNVHQDLRELAKAVTEISASTGQSGPSKHLNPSIQFLRISIQN